ncbi:MAG: GNAT family N-acetyltransferase [Rhodobacteraceae bacterium]|jgi:hypothetical protein|nr:GNAT family N-acetyltransferase [Paracoccaceae bacterium]
MATQDGTASRLSYQELTLRTASAEQLDAAAQEIFALFATREKEFGVNPDVTIDYPATEDLTTEDLTTEDAATAVPGLPFLTDPAGYVDRLLAAGIAADAPHGRVVILTTWADRIGDALVARGFAADPLDMPAGPDHTAVFDLVTGRPVGRILYIEAVNEADPRIRPTFALRLLDQDGTLRGGACGSVHARDGRRFAWISILAVVPGLPPGTGLALAARMMDLLRREGVGTIHLGTQTAAPFYQKLGFRVIRPLVRHLRFRQGADGRPVQHDLVMMVRDLSG